MFSKDFSAILNEFLNYFHICFNSVTYVHKQKKPLAGLFYLQQAAKSRQSTRVACGSFS